MKRVLVAFFCLAVGYWLARLAVFALVIDLSLHKEEFPDEDAGSQALVISIAFFHRLHVLMVVTTWVSMAVVLWVLAALLLLERL